MSGIVQGKDDKGKSLKEVFTDQQTQINALLDGTFKEKIESLKGHPKMNEIRDKSKQYYERLFDVSKISSMTLKAI